MTLDALTKDASHQEDQPIFQATGKNHGKDRQSVDLLAIRLNTLCQPVTITKDVFVTSMGREKHPALKAEVLAQIQHQNLHRILILLLIPLLHQTLHQAHGRPGSLCKRFVTTLITPKRTTQERCTRSTVKCSSSSKSSLNSSRLPKTIISSIEVEINKIHQPYL